MQSFGGDRMGGLLSELGPTGPETPEGDVTILAGPAATVPSANWCAVCSAGVHGGMAVHGRRRHNRPAILLLWVRVSPGHTGAARAGAAIMDKGREVRPGTTPAFASPSMFC